MIRVIQTSQLNPTSSNFSAEHLAIVHGLIYKGDHVFVGDRLDRYWRWGNWRHPFATTKIQLDARLANEKGKLVSDFYEHNISY